MAKRRAGIRPPDLDRGRLAALRKPVFFALGGLSKPGRLRRNCRLAVHGLSGLPHRRVPRMPPLRPAAPHRARTARCVVAWPLEPGGRPRSWKLTLATPLGDSSMNPHDPRRRRRRPSGPGMSYQLSQTGVEHQVHERRPALGAWQDRWDAFCLNMPNFSLGLIPGPSRRLTTSWISSGNTR